MERQPAHLEKTGPRVAIVDDEPSIRRLLRVILEKEGYQIAEYEDGESLLAEEGEIDAVCLDLGLAGMSGLEVLRHLQARDASIPVLMITGDGDTSSAVAAMRAGAYDYLVKPRDYERLPQALRNALERRDLLRRLQQLTHALEEKSFFHSLVGQSAPMRALAQQVERVLESDVPVAIFGETGTGKELIARAIHQGGRRRNGPFVALNCAAIPEGLLESELFGHEKGSFTGANTLRRGRFEQANRGTLFLDEIGEMNPSIQASLLRSLQEKTIQRVGGNTEIPFDVRIISATHRNLEEEVKRGRFRQDLYFRLVVYPIYSPPLRARRDDIPLLVGHFLRKYQDKVGRAIRRVHPETLEAMGRYHWPGNVRELENVVYRAMLSCDGEEILPSHLPPDVRAAGLPAHPEAPPQKPTGSSPDGVIPLKEVERRAILHAIRYTKGKIGLAAKLLGIGRATLYRRLAEYGIDPDEGGTPQAPPLDLS